MDTLLQVTFFFPFLPLCQNFDYNVSHMLNEKVKYGRYFTNINKDWSSFGGF